MAIDPEIYEGMVKPFGNNERKLQVGQSGMRRWNKIGQEEAGGNSRNEQDDTTSKGKVLTPQANPPNHTLMTDEQTKLLEQFIKGNPFLFAVSLEDIEDIWLEKMYEIKHEKSNLDFQIGQIDAKLQFVTDQRTINALYVTRDNLEKMKQDSTAEDKLNMQRIAYEAYRLNNVVTQILLLNPDYSIQTEISKGITMDDIEEELYKLESNAV